jgi:flavin reductase (DIM6/NTAB) family NADH-FMN oxidoreductase RutF
MSEPGTAIASAGGTIQVTGTPGPGGFGITAANQCRIINTVPAGDHTLLIAEVVSADIHSGTPLLFFGSGYRRLE